MVVEKGAPARGSYLVPFLLEFSLQLIDNLPTYTPTEGAKIFSADGSTQLGIVTSGLPSPTTKTNISMGYVSTQNGVNKKGSNVLVEVRGKMRKATVEPMPFVEAGYWRG